MFHMPSAPRDAGVVSKGDTGALSVLLTTTFIQPHTHQHIRDAQTLPHLLSDLHVDLHFLSHSKEVFHHLPVTPLPPTPSSPRMPVVSIHNRLQTYQLSAAAAAAAAVQPRSPESVALLNHRGELYQQPQHQPPLQCVSPTPLHSHQPVAALSELRPDTLIQCQQIVKVIVLDKGGHGRVEAFLSHSPSHHHQQFIQSVVSTPVRSPDGAGPQRDKDGSQPPLPPPPPPYNHPHQYIPPDPRLALQRTPSGSRSIV
ncbi:hypothetical protein AOLI_G00310050 [Acnodon oligacanthus]